MQLSFFFHVKYFIKIILLLQLLDINYLCSYKSLEYPVLFPCYKTYTAVWIYIT